MGDSIIAYFRWLYWPSRLAGLNSYRLPLNRSENTHLNRLDIILCASQIVFIIAIGHLNGLHNVHVINSRSVIMSTGFRIVLGAMTIQMVFLIVMDIRNRHNIWSILIECSDMDDEVKFNKIHIVNIRSWMLIPLHRLTNSVCNMTNTIVAEEYSYGWYILSAA